MPDITIKKRDHEKDEFLILACDGIWDVVSNEECVALVHTMLAEGETSPSLIAEEMLDIGLEKNSRDNMTSLVVLFSGCKLDGGLGGGVTKRRELRKAEKERLEKENEGTE